MAVVKLDENFNTRVYKFGYDDWAIDGLEVPVKINAVITDENNFGNISKIVNRWKDKKNVTVWFRHDFRSTTFENLHAMAGDSVLDYLCDIKLNRHYCYVLQRIFRSLEGEERQVRRIY